MSHDKGLCGGASNSKRFNLKFFFLHPNHLVTCQLFSCHLLMLPALHLDLIALLSPPLCTKRSDQSDLDCRGSRPLSIHAPVNSPIMSSSIFHIRLFSICQQKTQYTQTILSDIMTRINLLLAVSINWAGVVFERVNKILGCRCKMDIRKHVLLKRREYTNLNLRIIFLSL